jgi:Na+/serine symporter
MTVNMDGTALFEVVAALFVAQVFGVPIDLMGQVTLVILVLLTSIGSGRRAGRLNSDPDVCYGLVGHPTRGHCAGSWG